MPIFLGLDCGGSSCRAMAIDESGEPVFLAQGGSANIASTPEATLDRSLRKALEGAPRVDGACACFAGLIREEKRTEAIALLEPLVPGAKLLVEPDYAAALRACPAGTTVCVIAGTGSIVCSRVDGGLVKSGGGGFILGDEGSGYRYGRAALKHYLASPDKASESLRHAVHYLFDTDDPAEIVLKVYKAASPASLISGLSTALLKDVQAKESYAREALDGDSRALASVAAQHAVQYHPDVATPVFGLAGGLWKRSLFRDAFSVALTARLDRAKVVRSEMPPVRGAALLAMEAFS